MTKLYAGMMCPHCNRGRLVKLRRAALGWVTLRCSNPQCRQEWIASNEAAVVKRGAV